MAENQDQRIVLIAVMKIKADKVERAEELWHEQILDIDTTEPAGKIKYDLFRHGEGSEYVVIQEFESEEVMKAFYAKPKHEEIRGKVYGEELIEGEPEIRYCRRIDQTKR